MLRALLITDSPELRATVEILLGDQFAVEHAPAQTTPLGAKRPVDLVIADCAATGVAAVPEGDAPLLWVGPRPPFFGGKHGRRREKVLASAFEAFAFREAVRELLNDAGRRLPAPGGVLVFPYMPETAQTIVESALSNPLPLVICGEAGTGKRRVARAIHAQRGAVFLLSFGDEDDLLGLAQRLPASIADNDEVTVMVGDLAALPVSRQQLVLDLLEAGSLATPSGASPRVRLLVLTSRAPSALLREGALLGSLYYGANILALDLPPLRDRAADIPALAEAVARNLCETLGLSPVTFSPGAIERLQHYMWFGNLAEFEAAVARSLAFLRRPVIDAPDIMFGYPPLLPKLLRTSSAPTREAASDGAMVDLIIQELAHEFRNPMVTIKTFAQHLDRLLTQENGEAEVVRLTGDAIARMDEALENLVQFTRFEEPAKQPAALSSLVASAVGAIEDRIAEKRLVLVLEASTSDVVVDPSQVTYAIKNLVQSIVRELKTGDPLAIRSTGPGALTIEFPATARKAAQALSALVAPGLDAGAALPLGISLAKTLVERNGGALRTSRGGETEMITLELPRAGDGVERDGQTESAHR